MKTQVYSWRLSPHLKMDLEREARRRRISLSALLEGMAQDWLVRHRSRNDEAEQKRIWARVEKVIGKISGGNPHRSENVRALVEESVAKKYGR